MKGEQRIQVNQKFTNSYSTNEREYKVIQAETDKSVSEIKEKTITEEKRIDAEGEL